LPAAGEPTVTGTKTPRSRRVVPLSPTAERLLREVRANRAEQLRAAQCGSQRRTYSQPS
jgi:hypothetical protein